MTARERWMERLVAAAFAVTMLTGGALLVVYIAGADPHEDLAVAGPRPRKAGSML